MRWLFTGLVLLSLVASCAYPESGVRVVDDRPRIAIENAPLNSVLLVDGLDMGPASRFDGKENVLRVERGTHRIEVVSQGATILSEEIFLGGGELRVLKVHFSGGVE